MWFFPPDFVVGGSGIFYHAGEIEFDAALLNISNYEWGLGTWRSLSPHTKRKEFLPEQNKYPVCHFCNEGKS